MNRINQRLTMFIGATAAVPLLAGCYNGFDAQTNNQLPSGDGASIQVGDVMIRSATWVRSNDDSRTMTLSSQFVNAGTSPDELLTVSTEPKATAVSVTGITIPLAPLSETRTGCATAADVPCTPVSDPLRYINSYGLDVAPSGYVSTTFEFKRAGSVTVAILTVPATGYYENIKPVPAVIPNTPKATESSAVE